MSGEAVPRVGQIGTVITVTVDEPDPNNAGQFLTVDLTAEDGGCQIECQRPDKSRFKIAGTVPLPKTQGKIQATDNTGILNQAGLWRFRGIASLTGGLKFPGSWQEQRVGD